MATSILPLRGEIAKHLTPAAAVSKLLDLQAFLESHLNVLGACAAALRSANYEDAGIRADYVAETLDDYVLEKLRDEIDGLEVYLEPPKTPPGNSTQAVRPDKAEGYRAQEPQSPEPDVV